MCSLNERSRTECSRAIATRMLPVNSDPFSGLAETRERSRSQINSTSRGQQTEPSATVFARNFPILLFSEAGSIIFNSLPDVIRTEWV